MRLGVIIRCYHATDFLRPVLKSYKWVDKICLLNYRFKTAEPRPDDTEEIAESMKLHNLIFKKGEGLEQHEIFNVGMDILKDCDYIFINDADEIILPEQQKKMVENMQKNDRDAGMCPMLDYVADFYHSFNKVPRRVLMIVNPKRVKFFKIRQIKNNDFTAIEQFENYVYHFGFVLPPEKLNWKIEWEELEEGTDTKNAFRNSIFYPCPTVPHEVLDYIGYRKERVFA